MGRLDYVQLQKIFVRNNKKITAKVETLRLNAIQIQNNHLLERRKDNHFTRNKKGNTTGFN